MFPLCRQAPFAQRRCCRRLWLAGALALLACLFVMAGRSDAAAAPRASSEQFAMQDEISAARRFGGRRGFREGRRRWLAHRGQRHQGGRWKGERDHGRGGDDRPRAPEGQPKPHDQGGKPDDRPGGGPPSPGPKNPTPDRDPDAKPVPPPGIARPEPGPGAGRWSLARLSLPPLPPGGFGPPGPGSSPPAGTPQTPNQVPSSAGRDAFVPDEVLVTVTRATPESADAAVGQSHGLQLIERSTLQLLDRRLVRYRIVDGRPVAALLAALRADARIFDPQPNYYYRYQQDGSPRGRSVGPQYALAKLEAVRAQTLARGRGALVAVIDTGADTTHPDLAGRIVESFDAAGPARGVDPHGTAVAGIIAANGILRGVAPEAKLLNVRAFSSGPDGASAATTFSLLRGMDWALARRARVLNMSFTGPQDALLERGITAASGRGAIIVAAAGNGGANAPPAYPAAYAPVIAVTAVDFADRRYARANLGRYIALAAPGVDILTASADHAHRIQSGTSFAAAHVSGIIALMIERHPALTADDARRALMATAEDLGPPGPDDQYGAGRPNAFAALRALY